MGIKLARLALVAVAAGVVGYQLAAPRRRRPGTTVSVFCGNELTKVFHDSSCRYAHAEHSTARFATRRKAVDAGYEPCRVCTP